MSVELDSQSKGDSSQFTCPVDNEPIQDPQQQFKVSSHFALWYSSPQPAEQRCTQTAYVTSSVPLQQSLHAQQIMEDS